MLASEYRSWTLFYAVPVLQGILNEEYLQHFILYSEALWLLLQSTVSMDDINTAERLLQHFCFKFSVFYGMNMYEICMYVCIMCHFCVYKCR